MNARLVLVCGVLTAMSLCAQDAYPVGTLYFRAADHSLPPALDAPFCGERSTVRTKMQPDGTQKGQEYVPTKVCRDSAGRTRSDSPVYLTQNGPPVGPLLIEIRDPVAGLKYVVYQANKTAYRQQLQRVRTMHPPYPIPHPADEEVLATAEDLGTQMMEGLEVEGRRYTLPPGSTGEYTAATIISESWWSPQLAEFVMQKTNNELSGDRVERLINITREEPDPNLFRPPADYALVNKSGDFTILWGK